MVIDLCYSACGSSQIEPEFVNLIRANDQSPFLRNVWDFDANMEHSDVCTQMTGHHSYILRFFTTVRTFNDLVWKNGTHWEFIFIRHSFNKFFKKRNRKVVEKSVDSPFDKNCK